MKLFIILTLCIGAVYTGLIPELHLGDMSRLSKESQLRVSVLSNETAEVIKLIKDNVNVVVRYIDGHTPIHLSALMGHAHVTEILADHTTDINVLNADGLTPLYVAAQNSQAIVVDILLKKGANPNYQDPKTGKSALHVACELCSEEIAREIVDKLINSHADLNIRDRNGDLPLYYALGKGFSSIATKLIESGSDVDMSNAWKLSVMSCFARTERLSLRSILVSKGANIDNQWTDSLKEAINNGDVNATKILIKTCTSDLNEVKSPWPMHLAAFKGNEDIIELLHVNGGDVNAKDEYENTPLHWAAFNGQLNTARLLITYGAQVNSINLKGYTPLHLAAREGKADFSRLLCASSANVDVQSNKGNTPLHWAAYYGFEDVVKILLEYKSAIEIKNNGGLTATDFAKSKGNKAIVELLNEAKSKS